MTNTSPALVVHRPALVEKIPAGKLSTLEFWSELDENSQHNLQKTVSGITTELAVQWKSILRAGRLVEDLRSQTEPHGAFGKTLDVVWGQAFSKTTAYRFRNIYLTVRDMLSENVVELAIASGIELVTGDERRPFGAYTEIVQSIPAPKKNSMAEAQRWLEDFQIKISKLPHGVRGPASRSSTYTDLGCRAFKAFRSSFRQLPQDNRVRSRFLAEHVGYAMRLAGMSNSHSFEPSTPPPKWEKGRGRPRLHVLKKTA